MNIVVVTPNEIGYSETFIRAHIEHLPAAATIVGTPPRLSGD